MCHGKCLHTLRTLILPLSILMITLYQLYAQYSTLITLRTKKDNDKDGRNSLTNYKLTGDKQYDFNMDKIKESFEENALMRINFLKNVTLSKFENLKNRKDANIDIRLYMFYYLIIYDLIFILIVYFFLYGWIYPGFVKCILQMIRFYFNYKRIKKFNNEMCVFSIIRSKIQNTKIRGWSIFNPEGFLVIEFLCNFVLILDIILLILLIHRRRKMKRIKELNQIKEDSDDMIGWNNEVKEKDKENENNNSKDVSKGISESKKSGDDKNSQNNIGTLSRDDIDNDDEEEEGEFSDDIKGDTIQ